MHLTKVTQLEGGGLGLEKPWLPPQASPQTTSPSPSLLTQLALGPWLGYERGKSL